MKTVAWGALVFLTVSPLCGFTSAQTVDSSANSLKKLSLEELSKIEVTSVSKTKESLGGAAAAVAVVTNEDIRRSGAVNVPEALRLVPGIHVARQTSDLWVTKTKRTACTSNRNRADCRGAAEPQPKI